MSSNDRNPTAQYEFVSATYMSDRQLAVGHLGWVVLAALGVSYVIAGDYAAWNYGFARAGFGGMMIALVLMALMYLCLVFCLAELAAAIPTAGGGYAFARRAFGPTFGFVVGVCVVIEYVAITGAIGFFLASYLEALTGLKGIGVYVFLYAAFIAVHLCGVGEALKVLLTLSVIAALGIVLFAVMTLPAFSVARLHVASGDIPPLDASSVWAGLPFAIAFFLAVEGVPLASEEARDPARNIPRAMIIAWTVLVVLAVVILFAGPGAAGIDALLHSDSPMIAAMQGSARHVAPEAIQAVNIAGLVALAASFFSIMYAYSRQIFSLSRAGYLPRFLSLTNRRKSPWLALVLPGAVAFGLSCMGEGAPLVVMSVFCATLSYLLMLAAFLRLRVSEPTMARPYRTPGGSWTAALAFALALAAFLACLVVNPAWSLFAVVIIAALLAYFAIYSRHHLVNDAPEEEFAAIRCESSGASSRPMEM